MALIERSFREKIVVGVTIPPESVEETENSLDELALLVRHGRRRRGGPHHAAPAAGPAHLCGQGQGGRAARAGRGDRLRHGRVRQADAGPAVQPGEAARQDGHRPHGRHPRHLRPERTARRARRRSSWPSSATGCRGCGARRAPCPSRRAACPRPAAPASAPVAPARRSSRSTGAASCAASTARVRAEGDRPSPCHPAQGPAPQAARQGGHRRLHERRQVNAAQPADRRRGAGRGPPVRHPRRHHPPAGAAGRRAGPGDRHGGLHPQAAPPAGGGVRSTSTWPPTPTCWCTWSTPAPPTSPATSGLCARCWADRRRPRAGAAGVQQGRPRLGGGRRQVVLHEGSVAVSATTGEGWSASWRRSATGCGRSPPWSSWSSPTSGATSWPQPTGPARCWVRRRARVACTFAGASTTLRSGGSASTSCRRS